VKDRWYWRVKDKKIAGHSTGLETHARVHYPETCRSGPPDDTQDKRYDREYNQYMDQPAYTVDENTQKPTDQQYNRYQIQ